MDDERVEQLAKMVLLFVLGFVVTLAIWIDSCMMAAQ